MTPDEQSKLIVDALRAVLGLQPLYERERPSVLPGAIESRAADWHDMQKPGGRASRATQQ